MFGANYYGAPTFGSGPITFYQTVIAVFKSATSPIAGFLRYTRRSL